MLSILYNNLTCVCTLNRVPDDIGEVYGEEKYAATRSRYLDEINECGEPISIGTWAIALAVNCLQQSYPFGAEEWRDIEVIGMYFKSLTLSYDARKFMSDIYKWIGLGQEQQLVNKALTKIALEITLTSK